MDRDGRLTVLVGGQYGSEGKGVIAHHIADEYDFHVRVGGPNAGHSFKFKDRVFKMQGVPCGWTNTEAIMVIGAGGVVDPEILLRELNEAAEFDPSVHSRMLIDGNATVLDQRHHTAEGGVDGEMHQRIGSTGEGVGAARHARMARDPNGCILAKDVLELKKYISPHPVAELLLNAVAEGASVLIEGTQGSGLSLIHGPWPYTTSADTNAAQMVADVGLPPHWVDEVILVARTFPIRVAGNSGPLKDELTWEEMSRIVGRPVEERTTVTKKIRRIGRWDEELFMKGVRHNAPTQIALTFADYLSPEDEGKEKWDELSKTTQDFVYDLEELTQAPVAFVGTGGPDWSIVDVR